MAEGSSSRPEPKSLVNTDVSDEEDARPSTSTNSRRHSHYDTQRVGRRSRPVSGSSQAGSWKSQGKRASYQQPPDFQNLDEVAAPEPAGRDRKDSLEQRREHRLSPKTGLETKNFSRTGSTRKRLSGQQQQQGLSETEAPPSSSNAGAKKPLLEDPEAAADADDESSTAPPPFASRRPEEYVRPSPPLPKVSGLLTRLYTVSYLIFFSILGTLGRLGLQWLTFYPGTPMVTPVIWANFAGSLVMGFLSEDQRLFRDEWSGISTPASEKRISARSNVSDLEALNKAERAKRKKTISLYIGLATGFCGSLTSFSSFARDAFLGLSNNLPTPINHPNGFANGTPSTTATVNRNGGYSFEAWAAIVITTLALSLGGLIVGAHLALFMTPVTPRVSPRFAHRFLDPMMVVLGFGCWLGAIFLCIWPPDRPSGPASHGSWANETWRGEVLFALVFAPAGCLLRFYASLKLNSLVPAFPLGTFAVNMLGTAVEGMCYDIQHVGVGVMGCIGGGRVGCQVLQGVMDGFCGCLTTVSTWVVEINGLRRKHGWIYAFASVIGGLCLMVVIMGSVKWSVGWSAQVACKTGYTDKIYG